VTLHLLFATVLMLSLFALMVVPVFIENP